MAQLRWSDYVHVRGEEVPEMWAAAGAERSLLIVGEGFDPRMLVGVRKAIETGSLPGLAVPLSRARRDRPTSPRAEAARQNVAELEALAAAAGITHKRVPYPVLAERRALPRALLREVTRHPLFDAAGQIVVDISALPVGVYFGLIKGLLSLIDSGRKVADLQVTVAESVEIDRRIAGGGGESRRRCSASPATSSLDSDAREGIVVWSPVLGEGAGPQMEAINDRLRPDEICPVLPFPARNPRRADDLMLELRTLLVEELNVEPSNFIYADERNPFDLYRALTRLHERYRAALAPVGSSSVVLSLHSSKSLSLGALLAAYENDLPALNAEPEHYGFTLSGEATELLGDCELSGFWLAGLPDR